MKMGVLERIVHDEQNATTFEALTAYEEKLLRGTADTFRGLDDHEKMREHFNFREEIEGKMVCDLGSGHGGLAKTAAAEGIDTEIISVNPSLKRQDFKQAEEAGTADELRERYPSITDESIAAAQRKHDAGLVTAFAHSLPIEDGTFDLVVDTNAVHMYLSRTDSHLYPLILHEMLRILKPGGKIIIDDGYGSSIGVINENGDPEFKEALLIKIGVRYKVIYSERKIPLGAILYKD